MIALIPARGGSKGLPGKNIRNLNGKPLIAYTIEAAKKAKCIDEVIVTTDSKEIASIALEYGADVPFLRPSELATDTSSAIDVYLHAIEWISKTKNISIEKFMVLLPTTPFRDEKDIDDAYNLYQTEKARTLIAVKDAPIPPGWFLSEFDNKRVVPCNFGTGKLNENRQKSDRYVIPCGAIYILDYFLLKEKRTYYDANTVGYKLSNNKSVDINTAEDFQFAQYLIEKELVAEKDEK